MSRLSWSVAGTRFYEAGVDRGVLYVRDLPGVAWVGLTGVDENPIGAETKAYYIDGVKFLNVATTDEFEASIKAYTYPSEFAECDGTARIRAGLFFGQQVRKPFGFSYRTFVGNDTNGLNHGYKIHLVYNALAIPSSRSAATFANSIEAYEFSWNVTTKPVKTAGLSATAHVVIDSRNTHPVTLAAIEDILYGTDEHVARLPTPQELIDIFDVPVAWAVVDNEDGTFEVSGPDEMVADVGAGLFVIDHPDVAINDEDSFTITYS